MLWLIVSILLMIALIWTALRRRHEARVSFPGGWDTIAEDAVKVIANLEREQHPVSVNTLASRLGISAALAEAVARILVASDWVKEETDTSLRLTDRGRRRAAELIWAHRLWEQYLVERQGMPLDAVHDEADRREHAITVQEATQLDAELGRPVRDPHGHVISEPGQRMPPTGGIPLAECMVGKPLRILHVPDNPPALLSQLVAMGLTPGTVVQIVSQETERLWVKTDDAPLPLAREAAERMGVVPVPALSKPMGELPLGSHGHVVETTGQGVHQRRMLDMGLVPGAEVTVLRAAPLGDPVAYLVTGTVISMRRSDANSVLVEEQGGANHGSTGNLDRGLGG